MIWVILILLGCILTYWFVIKPLRHWKEMEIPYIPGYPLAGSFPEIMILRRKAFFDVTKEMYKRFSNER